MCTLSVVTREDGFLLGMNRDERLERGPAVPPKLFSVDDIDAIYPLDVKGGTWIGVSQFGMAFALLNRNEPQAGSAPREPDRSRGLVIPALIHLPSLAAAEAQVEQLRLDGLPPFRLIGIFSEEEQFREWNWDGVEISAAAPRWGARHWFSSGLSDAKAEVNRSKVCQRAWVAAEAGTAPWLQRLHASHINGPGPFSLCVHRHNVQTVSYTEITRTRDEVRLAYFPGSPCTRSAGDPVFVETI
jgi:transport and Golgi organization protein 2